MRNQSKKGYFKRSGQSIVELSLLGAALLSIIGILIRISISTSQSKDVALTAMRKAFYLSAQEALNENSSTKTTYRKNAMVLWIDDKPAVEGGQKYGSSASDPVVSMGSGSFTNLLEYPVRYGDKKQLPLMDMYVNGQHFTFTLAGYKCLGETCSTPASKNIIYSVLSGNNYIGNPDLCTNPNPYSGERNGCGFFYKKIYKTDSQWETPYQGTTYDDEVWRYKWNTRLNNGTLSNVDLGDNGGVVPYNKRDGMIWQWREIEANSCTDSETSNGSWCNGSEKYGINFYGKDSNRYVDVDFDGREEYIIDMLTADKAPLWSEDSYTSLYETFDGNSYRDYPQCSDFNYCCPNDEDKERRCIEGDHLIWVKVLDYDEGDLAMNYTLADKAKGIPQPGFNSAKASIKTYSTGDLNMNQQANTAGTLSTIMSKQTKETINIVEREIQLSNDTGRFRPGCNVNDPTTCGGLVEALNDCNSNQNKFSTCFDQSSLILYVRSLVGTKIGHKYKTIAPIKKWF